MVPKPLGNAGPCDGVGILLDPLQILLVPLYDRPLPLLEPLM
jgi:hypothetical protein